MMGWGGQGYGMWGMGGFGGIVMILFWILVIAGIVLLLRYFTGQGHSPGNRASTPYDAPGDPLQILKARYARGEIDTEEYNERRKTLEGGK